MNPLFMLRALVERGSLAYDDGQFWVLNAEGGRVLPTTAELLREIFAIPRSTPGLTLS